MTEVLIEDGEPESFMAYWNQLDSVLMKLFGRDIFTLNISTEEIAEAQDGGWTPEELAADIGVKQRLARF